MYTQTPVFQRKRLKMREIWCAVLCRRWLGVAVLLPLVLAATLQAGANERIHGVAVGLGKKPKPSDSVTRTITSASGTFVFENVQPGSYTIWAELPAGQRQTIYSSFSATINFTALSPSAANAKVKAAPFAASGPHVMNNTLQVTGSANPRVFIPEDFTLSAPATITGTISGSSSRTCGKGETEINGKCIPNIHIPNNVTGDALTHDPNLGTGNGPNRPAPPPVHADAAGVVNSSRSNIKNNLAVADDPSGPVRVTGITCMGSSSVSITTNHAVPADATYVITSAMRQTVFFLADKVTRDANGGLQIPFDASNGTYTLDIQNANGISILPKPLPVINCAPR
jgi:hypothetical protein